MRGAKVFALAKRNRIPSRRKGVRLKRRAQYMTQETHHITLEGSSKEGLCSPSWEYQK
jgi:hypothetical protein